MGTYNLKALDWIVLFTLLAMGSQAQQKKLTEKKIIDTAVLNKSSGLWSNSIICKISPDGNFILKKNSSDTVLTVYDKRHAYSIADESRQWFYEFSDDSKFLYYNRKDQLLALNLSSGKTMFVDHAKSINAYHNDHGLLLVYTQAQQDGDLILFNPKFNKRYAFKNSTISGWSKNKNELLIKVQNQDMLSINLITGKIFQLTGQKEIHSYCYDEQDNRLAFVGEQNKLQYYVNGAQKTIALPDSISRLIKSNEHELRFNRSGDVLVIGISILSPGSYVDQKGKVKLRIWNYADLRNPIGNVGEEDQMPGRLEYYALDLHQMTTKRICGAESFVQLPRSFDDYLLVRDEQTEDFWYNPNHAAFYQLVNLHTGEKRKIVNFSLAGQIFVSPQDKYVVWFDSDSLTWCAYDTKTQIKRNLTSNIPYSFFDQYQLGIRPKFKVRAYGMAGWSSADKGIYLYDQYDIWKVDLDGLTAPVCISNNEGRKQRITLSIANTDDQEDDRRIIKTGSKQLLCANDELTKNNGLWELTSDGTLNQGKMLPYILGKSRYTRIADGGGNGEYGKIIPMGSGKGYLVELSSAEKFRNWFQTTDFINYKQITNSQPQKDYNWLTSELVPWDMPDGSKAQGILYKPENFDPQRKYPLIFQCYQGKGNGLHIYHSPEYSGDDLNIPYYVSNGYLVFLPDIFWQKGKRSEAITESVLGARKELIKRAYVDSTRLGIQGHSFGGYDVNIVITHSGNAFAAACESAGVSNIVTKYNEVFGNYPGGGQFWYEFSSQFPNYGKGVTPWSDPSAYIKDSPVFFTDSVSTPLLMLHGDKDYVVFPEQGTGFFLALRRAGKKAWLLEYPNDSHGNDIKEDAKDFTIRMKQFFDHYLTGAPAPKWMTNTVDVAGHQSKAGYELNSPGIQP